tara:strand:+ start:634 stop:873 length:240 start_codon:yes stop_codon:yes gene_type:complete
MDLHIRCGRGSNVLLGRSKIEHLIGGYECLDLLPAKTCCRAASVNRSLRQAGFGGGVEFTLVSWCLVLFGAVLIGLLLA